MGEVDERHGRQGHGDADEGDLADHGERRDDERSRRVRRVVHSERASHAIPDQRRHEGRDQGVVFHAPHHDDLEPEQRPRDRRPEDRAEAARHACCEQLPAAVATETEAVRDRVRQASAHLHGGALASGAAAEEMGQDRADQHHRRHAERDLRLVFVHAVDDEVRAPANGLSPPRVDEPDPQAGKGQGVHEHLVRVAERRDALEKDQEDPRGQAGRRADGPAEREPLREHREARPCDHRPLIARRRAGNLK